MNSNLQAQIEKIITIVDKLSKGTNEIGITFHGEKGNRINLKGFVFLDLMQRINANLEALFVLLKSLRDSPELASPIALILRACLSDVLTGYYLYTYLEDETSFENEVKVMGLDFASYMLKMSEEETKFSAKDLSDYDREQLILQQKNRLASIYTDSIKSVNQNTGIVTKYKRSEIRDKSKQSVLLAGQSINDSITDEKKYNRLRNYNKSGGLKDVAYIYLLMRFYAQFQHYSFYNREVDKIDLLEKFPLFVQSFYYITGAIYTFGTLIEANNEQLENIKSLLDQFDGFTGLSIN